MQNTSRSGLINAIVVAGLIAGTMDISCACIWAYINSGTTPDIILRYVASGLVGRELAFNEGVILIPVGLAIHYCIAFSWTVVFFLLYPKIPSLAKLNPIITSIFYGAVVWTVMNFVVLPLTKVPPLHFTLKGSLVGAGILMFAIGLPCVILAKKYYEKK